MELVLRIVDLFIKEDGFLEDVFLRNQERSVKHLYTN